MNTDQLNEAVMHLLDRFPAGTPERADFDLLMGEMTRLGDLLRGSVGSIEAARRERDEARQHVRAVMTTIGLAIQQERVRIEGQLDQVVWRAARQNGETSHQLLNGVSEALRHAIRNTMVDESRVRDTVEHHGPDDPAGT